MYSKNFILFFYVALNFLQCQGVFPDTIIDVNEMIEEYSSPEGTEVDGTINLKGVRDIIEEVERRFNTNKEIPTDDALETIIGSNYKFNEDDVNDLLKTCIVGNEKVALNAIGTLFDSNPGGITFDDLEDLIKRLKETFTFTGNVPYYVEPKTSIPYKMSLKDYKFKKPEVNYIVTDILFPGDDDE